MFRQQQIRYGIDDPKTVLSLSTGVQRTQETIIRKQHHTSCINGRNHGNSSGLKRNLTKEKRQRSPDDSCRLTIGIGSSPSNVDPTLRSYEASPYQQCANGVCSQNVKRISVPEGSRRASTGSEIEVNELTAANRSCSIFSDLRHENASRRAAAYSRAAAAYRETPQINDNVRDRMIKNRESVARSGVRRQAEEAQQVVENSELKNENDVLKRIVRYLLAILRKKHMRVPSLSRSYSAPL